MWNPNRTSFEKLIDVMVQADTKNIKNGNIFDFGQVKLMAQFRE